MNRELESPVERGLHAFVSMSFCAFMGLLALIAL